MLRILIAMQALISTVAAQQYNKELVQAALVPKSKNALGIFEKM